MLSLTPAKPIKVSDIYLSKEQINSQTPGNLLHLFFTNVRPPKKVLEDQLTQVATPSLPHPCWALRAPGAESEPPPSPRSGAPQILRKYGVPKPKFDKSKYSKAGKEQHPGKVVSTKRPITKPPAKDKAVLNSARWVTEELGRWAGQGDAGPPPSRLPGRLLAPWGSQTSWLFSALLPGSFSPLPSSAGRERFILPTRIVKSGPCRLESRPV